MAALTKKQRFWKEHLDALEGYAGTAAEYAREHDLDPKKLYVYKTAIAQREAQQPPKAAFVRVNASAAAREVTATVIRLPNGVQLSVPTLSSEFLERLARL